MSAVRVPANAGEALGMLEVTRGQAGEHKAAQALAQGHAPLLAGLRHGDVITKSVALQLATWTCGIPDEFRAQAEEIVVAATRADRLIMDSHPDYVPLGHGRASCHRR